jgi:restriction system protein
MKKTTVQEAATKALEMIGKPSSIKEIFDIIALHDLYHFNTEKPQDIVKTSVRRHTKGLEFPSARTEKYFQLLKDGKYWIINEPIPGKSPSDLKIEIDVQNDAENLRHIVEDLKNIHLTHTEAFKSQILNQLMQIDPRTFEVFSKRLLDAYGFQKMIVTKLSRDGGIDGHGELKVGITYINVAFQCKRWKNNVGRPELDKFRGAISGPYEMGIIFTTSKFTREAIDASRRHGAVPIMLIDGKLLIDIMIEKKFGIETENIPVYINALDNVLNEEK